MHLKIPLLSRGLKLSNSKPGCRVSALHFFVKLCFTAGKRIGGLKLSRNLRTPESDHLHIYSLWGRVAEFEFSTSAYVSRCPPYKKYGLIYASSNLQFRSLVVTQCPKSCQIKIRVYQRSLIHFLFFQESHLTYSESSNACVTYVGSICTCQPSSNSDVYIRFFFFLSKVCLGGLDESKRESQRLFLWLAVTFVCPQPIYLTTGECYGNFFRWMTVIKLVTSSVSS